MLPKVTHPLFEAEIPSTKQTIQMRPMLVKEEKILLMSKESGEKSDILSAIKQVVKNCIETEHVDVDQLALFDVEYLYIKLRQQSVSNIITVVVQDGEDKKDRSFDIDLENVNVKFPEKDYSKIKVGNVELEFKYPPASLYSDKVFASAKGEHVFDYLLASSIKSIKEKNKVYNLKDSSFEELIEWIDTLGIPAYDQIKEYFNNLPTLYYEIKYTNDKDKERTVVLSSLTDFFTLA